MARKRLLPSDSELKRLVDKGMTHKEIGDKYGTTRQAVATALSRAGLTDQHLADSIPEEWRPIMTKHHRSYNMRMLRAHDRVLRNDPTLSDEERHRHQLWLDRLADDDAVVDYNPKYVDGFYFVRRRPGIDTDVFRVPDGRPR